MPTFSGKVVSEQRRSAQRMQDKITLATIGKGRRPELQSNRSLNGNHLIFTLATVERGKDCLSVTVRGVERDTAPPAAVLALDADQAESEPIRFQHFGWELKSGDKVVAAYKAPRDFSFVRLIEADDAQADSPLAFDA